MEKDKSRGLKHIKDKQKYRGKSTKNPKHVPPKAKPSLGTNWDRYEFENEEEGFKLSSSTDFSILSNAPINQGHRFQFKRDKLMIQESENKNPSGLFCLDLKQLEDSIMCIPFFERVGINEKYFSNSQLKFMKMEAEANSLHLNEQKKKHWIDNDNCLLLSEECQSVGSISSNDKLQNNSIGGTSNVQSSINKTEYVKDISSENKDSNKLLNKSVGDTPNILCSITKTERVKEIVGAHKNGDDLEQWLDDILDN